MRHPSTPLASSGAGRSVPRGHLLIEKPTVASDLLDIVRGNQQRPVSTIVSPVCSNVFLELGSSIHNLEVKLRLRCEVRLASINDLEG